MNQFNKGDVVGPLVHVAQDLEKIINDLDSKRYRSYLHPFMDWSKPFGN